MPDLLLYTGCRNIVQGRKAIGILIPLRPMSDPMDAAARVAPAIQSPYLPLTLHLAPELLAVLRLLVPLGPEA